MTSPSESWWAEILGGTDVDLHATGSEEQYVVLPRASDPRVVVDASDPRALRDAITRYMGNRTNLMSGPLAGGATAILGRRRPTWGVASPHGTLREFLSAKLDTNVRLSIAVGPPRPNRKPVVRCYSEEGLVAVVKMGPDPHTAAMIDNEAQWLERLEQTPLDGVVTPKLRFRGRYGSSEVLAMEPLDLHVDGAVEFGDMPFAVLEQFTQRFSEEQTLAASAWWASLRERVSVPGLEEFQQVAQDLDNDPDLAELHVSGWHGDWSPWNTGQLRDGRLGIWDWERTAVGAPTGLDLLHLHHQYGSGLQSARSDLERLGVPLSHHRLVAIVYLLVLAARHSEGGALDSDRQRRVTAALRSLLPPTSSL